MGASDRFKFATKLQRQVLALELIAAYQPARQGLSNSLPKERYVRALFPREINDSAQGSRAAHSENFLHVLNRYIRTVQDDHGWRWRHAAKLPWHGHVKLPRIRV
jgi:hypothetical protein